MLRVLRFCGLVLLNVVVALLGTAVVETAFGEVIPAHSLAVVLWKAWTLSIVCAGLIGFGMWRTWRSDPAKWTWILLTLWFTARFLPAAFSQRHVLHQFSGAACGNGVSGECLDFLVFTIPFIRGLSYSFGAYVSSLVYSSKRRPEPVSQISTTA